MILKKIQIVIQFRLSTIKQIIKRITLELIYLYFLYLFLLMYFSGS